MQYYLFILTAVVLLALQFSTNKAYSIRCGSTAKASLTFSTLSGLASAVISLIIALTTESFRITGYSLRMAVIVAVLCCAYTFIGFQILSLGSLSVFTLFLMLGGMLLPYLFGVLRLGEPISVWRVIGVILLAASLAFPVLAREKSGKSGVLFFLLCAAVFVLNGCVSIVSKLHQINTVELTSGAATFSFLSNLANSVISAIGLGVLSLRSGKKKTDAAPSESGTPKTAVHPGVIAIILFANAACNGVSYVLQLVSAGKVPASVLYPMITGGSVVLSALAGFLFFREKPDKISLLGLLLSFAATFLFLF